MGQKKSLWQKGEATRAYWLFVAPALALYLLVMLIPTLMSIALSASDFRGGQRLFEISFSYDGMNEIAYKSLKTITNTNGIEQVLDNDKAGQIKPAPWRFKGFSEYNKLVKDPNFYKALKNNIYVVLISVLGQIPLGFLFAYIIYRKLVKGASLWQAIIYMPAVLSTIIIGITWQQFLYRPDGAFGKTITSSNQEALYGRLLSLKEKIKQIDDNTASEILSMISPKAKMSANYYPLDEKKQLELFTNFINNFLKSANQNDPEAIAQAKDNLKDELSNKFSNVDFKDKFRNTLLNTLIPSRMVPREQDLKIFYDRYLSNDASIKTKTENQTLAFDNFDAFKDQITNYINNFKGSRPELKNELTKIFTFETPNGDFRKNLDILLPDSIELNLNSILPELLGNITLDTLVKTDFYPVNSPEANAKLILLVQGFLAESTSQLEKYKSDKKALEDEISKEKNLQLDYEKTIAETQKTLDEAKKSKKEIDIEFQAMLAKQPVFQSTDSKVFLDLQAKSVDAVAKLADAELNFKNAQIAKRNSLYAVSSKTLQLPAISKQIERAQDSTQYAIDRLSTSFGDKYGITEFTNDSNLAMIPVLFVILWLYTGLYLILFLANMQKIDVQIIEAASIDGASEGQVMRHIILPSLSGVIVINAILAISGSLRAFDLIYAMTSGGPANNTTVLALYMFNNAFGSQIKDIPYANALSTVMVLISVLLIIVTRFIEKKFGSKE